MSPKRSLLLTVVIVIVSLMVLTGPAMAAPTFQSPVQPPEPPKVDDLCKPNDLACWWSAFQAIMAKLTGAPSSIVADKPKAEVEVAPDPVDESCVTDNGTGFYMTSTQVLAGDPVCPAAFEWHMKNSKGGTIGFGVAALLPGENITMTASTSRTIEGTVYVLGTEWKPDGRFIDAQTNLSDGMRKAWIVAGGSESVTVKRNYVPVSSTIFSAVVTTTTALPTKDVDVDGASAGKSAMAAEDEDAVKDPCKKDTLSFSTSKGTWRVGSPSEECPSIVAYVNLTSTESMTATVNTFVLEPGSFVFMPFTTRGVQVFAGGSFADVELAQQEAGAAYCSNEYADMACVVNVDTLPLKTKILVSGH